MSVLLSAVTLVSYVQVVSGIEILLTPYVSSYLRPNFAILNSGVYPERMR